MRAALNLYRHSVILIFEVFRRRRIRLWRRGLKLGFLAEGEHGPIV